MCVPQVTDEVPVGKGCRMHSSDPSSSSSLSFMASWVQSGFSVLTQQAQHKSISQPNRKPLNPISQTCLFQSVWSTSAGVEEEGRGGMKNTGRSVREMYLSFTVCVVNRFISAVILSPPILCMCESVNACVRTSPGHFKSTEMERYRRSILPNQFSKFGAVHSNCGLQRACRYIGPARVWGRRARSMSESGLMS